MNKQGQRDSVVVVCLRQLTTFLPQSLLTPSDSPVSVHVPENTHNSEFSFSYEQRANP